MTLFVRYLFNTLLCHRCCSYRCCCWWWWMILMLMKRSKSGKRSKRPERRQDTSDAQGRWIWLFCRLLSDGYLNFDMANISLFKCPIKQNRVTNYRKSPFSVVGKLCSVSVFGFSLEEIFAHFEPNDWSGFRSTKHREIFAEGWIWDFVAILARLEKTFCS